MAEIQEAFKSTINSSQGPVASYVPSPSSSERRGEGSDGEEAGDNARQGEGFTGRHLKARLKWPSTAELRGISPREPHG